MNDIPSYEKIIKRKVKGKYLFAKILLISLYALIALIGIVTSFIFAFKYHSPKIISISLIVCAADYLFFILTWKLTCIEYECSFTAGIFNLSKIYGKSRRRTLFESELSRAVIVAPYNDEYMPYALTCNANSVYEAISEKNAKNIWFMVFEEESGHKALVIFEVDEKALYSLRHYAPRAMVRNKGFKDLDNK